MPHKVYFKNGGKLPLIIAIVLLILYIFSFFTPSIYIYNYPEANETFTNNFQIYFLFHIFSMIKSVSFLIFSIFYFKKLNGFRKANPHGNVGPDVGFSLGFLFSQVEILIVTIFPLMLCFSKIIIPEDYFIEILIRTISITIFLNVLFIGVIASYISSYVKYANY